MSELDTDLTRAALRLAAGETLDSAGWQQLARAHLDTPGEAALTALLDAPGLAALMHKGRGPSHTEWMPTVRDTGAAVGRIITARPDLALPMLRRGCRTVGREIRAGVHVDVAWVVRHGEGGNSPLDPVLLGWLDVPALSGDDLHALLLARQGARGEDFYWRELYAHPALEARTRRALLDEARAGGAIPNTLRGEHHWALDLALQPQTPLPDAAALLAGMTRSYPRLPVVPGLVSALLDHAEATETWPGTEMLGLAHTTEAEGLRLLHLLRRWRVDTGYLVRDLPARVPPSYLPVVARIVHSCARRRDGTLGDLGLHGRGDALLRLLLASGHVTLAPPLAATPDPETP